MYKSACTIISKSVDAIAKDASDEHSRLRHIWHQIKTYPAKAIAAFFTAPILIIKVALTVKDPIRRIIAVTGIVLALILAYVVGTLAGTVAFALIVVSSVGWLAAIGFLVGSMVSVVVTVTLSVFVFLLVSFVFLKMSSQEAVDYLREISC